MMGATKRNLPHPSNRLYRGECGSFREAMGLVMAQCDRETVPVECPEDKQLNESLAQMKATAKRLLAEYESAIGEAEKQFFLRWVESIDENERMIGQAGLDEDWSTLAI